MQIEVAGVDTHNEGHGGTQHVSQHQWAQRNVGALPLQREDHLEHQRERSSEQGLGQRWGGGAGDRESLPGGWAVPVQRNCWRWAPKKSP